MSDTGTLVFRDGEGEYFLLPRATLEQGRVPVERKAEVERLIAESAGEASAEGDDVRGHAVPVIGLIILAELAGIGFEIGVLAPELVNTKPLKPLMNPLPQGGGRRPA